MVPAVEAGGAALAGDPLGSFLAVLAQCGARASRAADVPDPM